MSFRVTPPTRLSCLVTSSTIYRRDTPRAGKSSFAVQAIPQQQRALRLSLWLYGLIISFLFPVACLLCRRCCGSSHGRDVVLVLTLKQPIWRRTHVPISLIVPSWCLLFPQSVLVPGTFVPFDTSLIVPSLRRRFPSEPRVSPSKKGNECLCRGTLGGEKCRRSVKLGNADSAPLEGVFCVHRARLRHVRAPSLSSGPAWCPETCVCHSFRLSLQASQLETRVRQKRADALNMSTGAEVDGQYFPVARLDDIVPFGKLAAKAVQTGSHSTVVFGSPKVPERFRDHQIWNHTTLWILGPSCIFPVCLLPVLCALRSTQGKSRRS